MIPTRAQLRASKEKAMRRSAKTLMARRRRAARAYQVRAYRSAATTRRVLNVLPRRATSEVKCVDTTAGNGSGVILTLSTTPLVTPVNLIQSGAGFYNRIGRRIEMKSLHLTGLIHGNGNNPIKTIVVFS